MKELYRDNGFAVLTDREQDNTFVVQGEPILSIENVAENWTMGVFKRLGLDYEIVSFEDRTKADKGRWHSFWIVVK